MSSRHQRSTQRAPKPDGAKSAQGETIPIPGLKAYKKIHISELPIIELNSGPIISQIREALIQYCQRELGPIAGIFMEGSYRPPATALYNLEEIKADSTGLKKEEASSRIKRADIDNDTYEKAKIKLHGILSGMTSREVDERIQAHRDSLKKMEPSITSNSTSRFSTLSPSSTPLQESPLASNFQCPLTLWKHIVHVTTTRTIGNARVDQNNLAINFANIKQRSNESVADFKRRMQNLLDSFDAIRLERPKAEMVAMRFLHGLEDSRYGALKVWLGNEAANRRDLYPNDLDAAASQATLWITNTHRPANVPAPPPALNAFVAAKSKHPKKEKDTPHPKKLGSTDQKNEDVCDFCTRKGHKMDKCFKFAAAKKAAGEAAAMPREKAKQRFPPAHGVMFAQQDYDSDTDMPMHKVNFHTFCYDICTTSLLSRKSHGLRSTDLILDTGANGSIVHNLDLLHNIKSTPQLTFGGLAGSLHASQKGTLRDMCSAYYHPESPANILSFSQLREANHDIRFSTEGGSDAFIVTTQDYSYKFEKREDGLYICDLSPVQDIMIATVQDNEAAYSKREVGKAKAARSLQERMANPPDNKLAKAIAHGNITYSDISAADIARATTIYGHNPNALQGRTVTRTAEPFPIPQETLRNTAPQELYGDIFMANGLSFLLTVAKPLEHLLATHIETRDTSSLRKALRTHLSFYSRRRIHTPILYTDNERGLAALGIEIANAGIQLIHSGSGTHVHTVERAIRYIKEGVRSVHAGLPYTCPRSIFKTLIPFVAQRLNMFPTSTRTDNLSAYQLVYNRPADARRDCHLCFGAVYHVTHRESSNSMMPRTIVAIGVAQIPNGTGTCSFFAIHNQTIITANHFTMVPMTPDVISHMNRLAKNDKVHTLIDAPYYVHGRALTEPATLADSRELHHAAPSIQPVQPTSVNIEMIKESDETADSTNIELPTALEISPAVPTLQTVENSTINNEDIDEHTEPITEATDEHTQPVNTQALPVPTEEPDTPSTLPTVADTPPLGASAASPTARKYPSRERKPPNRLTLHMTAKRALREDPATARPAIEAELKTLISKGVFRPILTSTLTESQRRGIIRSQLNVTQKYLPTTDGAGRVKDKVKARLVGGGDCQDRELYSAAETSSPTISITSIFILVQIAASERMTVVTLDIGSAYLNALMPKSNPNKLVFMRISKEVAAIMVGVDSTFTPFIHQDGTLIIELDRALYGCIESALLWHKELSGFLSKIGFQPNPQDICVLNRVNKEGKATIGIYVDDLLLTCSSPTLAEAIVLDLEREYKQLKITRGARRNYLGMVLDFSTKGVVKINQSGMIEEITRTPGVELLSKAVGATEENPKTPCHDLLFRMTEDSPPLDQPLCKIVHSITAKILFVANRGRPDVLTFISFMTKRVLHPTQEDGRKLLRALHYLARTSELDLTLGYTGAPTISVYIDASFGVHQDRKSHTGVFTTLGRGAVYTKSTTQKINTTSSCEAELVAVSKGLQQSLWAQSFMTYQGLSMPPLLVYQDNQSTVKLLQRGRPAAE